MSKQNIVNCSAIVGLQPEGIMTQTVSEILIAAGGSNDPAIGIYLFSQSPFSWIVYDLVNEILYKFFFNFDSNDRIKPQICTFRDISAVVACMKL